MARSSITLLALFSGCMFGAEAPELLRRAAGAYEVLSSFELTASLSVEVPGKDLIITLGQTEFYASNAMLPPDSPVPVLEYGTVGGKPTYRNRAGQEVQASVSGFPIGAFAFPALYTLDKRVASARMLPDEVLTVGDTPVTCAVVEVRYEKRTPFDGGLGWPVRLWIDRETSLVWQAAYVRDWTNGEFAQWTARVERMTINRPPSTRAIEQAAGFKGREELRWVGQTAPEFSLKSLDGKSISSRSLRGRVVVLNFWASWCGPCREEMMLLEKVRAEMTSQDVEFWGVSNEAPEVARQWLTERKRSLPTLVDSGRLLFKHYAVESIPVLVILDRRGKVSTHVVGLRGERDLRTDIATALERTSGIANGAPR